MSTFVKIDIFGTNNKLDIDNIASTSKIVLESHANIPVVGLHTYILSNSSYTANINA